MDFSKPSKAAGNLVDSLKDKLNFAKRGGAQDEGYDYDEFYEDEFADDAEYGEYSEYSEYHDYEGFDEYGEMGFDKSYAKGADAYNDSYSDPYSSRGGYTTREAFSTREAYRPPRLVSLSDVQNSTTAFGVVTPTGAAGAAGEASKQNAGNSFVPGYLSSTADARFASRTASGSGYPADALAQDEDDAHKVGFDRPNTRYSEFVSPYQRGSQNAAASTQVMPSTGSAGLDNLFTATDESAANTQSIGGGRFARKVEIFEPKDFEQAVQIVDMLKEGSVVVLNLRFVNAGLSKRVLDFAFGVVAALGAQIHYEAPQVFCITQGEKLTLIERDQLRNKRIL